VPQCGIIISNKATNVSTYLTEIEYALSNVFDGIIDIYCWPYWNEI